MIAQKDLARFREIAEGAVLRVGPRIQDALASREAVSITHKGAVNLVTEIDLWSEATIVEYLDKHTPEICIIAEEGPKTLDALAQALHLRQTQIAIALRDKPEWFEKEADGWHLTQAAHREVLGKG